MYTCLSCSVAFPSPSDQRIHYRSDHHRYNLKRRVAGLPPVSAAVFAQKLVDRTQDDAPTQSDFLCTTCGKSYSSENAYSSHLASRKHRDNACKDPSPAQPHPGQQQSPTLPSATSCLFCTATSPSLEDNLSHMASAHSFFIPDADYLVDISGLIDHLAEKIAVANVCIYCNGKGRELHSLDAVRKHMLDRGHCKIAYDSESDKLDVSDYYDFTSSYPKDTSSPSKKALQGDGDGDGAWEDVDDDGGDGDQVDQVVDADDLSDAGLPENQLTYGDTEYELVLPSGARVGHRSMMRYYAQSFHGIPTKSEDPNSGAALVRRLLADKHSALVPRKGGFGAFGQGTQVVKARNRGEAREAGRHIREYRDQRRREDFKTKVAFIHNSQKHFRDPLLQ